MINLNLKKTTKMAFASIAAVAMLFSSCNQDEIDDLKADVNQLKTDVSDLKAADEAFDRAIKAGKLITKVDKTATGWTVTFSDNSTINITNGTNGINGTPGTPGTPGAAGTNGVTPILKVDAEGYWVVSYDKGVTFARVKDANNKDVKAQGEQGIQGIPGTPGTPGADGADGLNIKVVELSVDGKIYYAFQQYKIVNGDQVNVGDPIVTPYLVDKSNLIGSIVYNADDSVSINMADGESSYKFAVSVTYPTSIVVYYAGAQTESGKMYFDVKFRANPSNAVVKASNMSIDLMTSITRSFNIHAAEFLTEPAFKADLDHEGEYSIRYAIDVNKVAAFNENTYAIIYTKNAYDALTQAAKEIQVSSNVFASSFSENFTTATLRTIADQYIYEKETTFDLNMNFGTWSYNGATLTYAYKVMDGTKDVSSLFAFASASKVNDNNSRSVVSYTANAATLAIPAGGSKELTVAVTVTDGKGTVAKTDDVVSAQSFKLTIYSQEYAINLTASPVEALIPAADVKLINAKAIQADLATVLAPCKITAAQLKAATLGAAGIANVFNYKATADANYAANANGTTQFDILAAHTAAQDLYSYTLTAKATIVDKGYYQVKTTLPITVAVAAGRNIEFKVTTNAEYNVVMPTAFDITVAQAALAVKYDEANKTYALKDLFAAATTTPATAAVNDNIIFYLSTDTKFKTAKTDVEFAGKTVQTAAYRVKYTYKGVDYPATVNGAETFTITATPNSITDFIMSTGTPNFSFTYKTNSAIEVAPYLGLNFTNHSRSNTDTYYTYSEALAQAYIAKAIKIELMNTGTSGFDVNEFAQYVFGANAGSNVLPLVDATEGKIKADWSANKYLVNASYTLKFKFTVTDVYGNTKSVEKDVTLNPEAAPEN